MGIVSFITEIFLWIAYPFVLVASLFVENIRNGLKDRLGSFEKGVAGKDGQCTVFCCASVGEVSTAAPFIDKWILDHPGERVIIATTTPTGKKHARRMYLDNADSYIRPLDFGYCPKRWLDTFNPARIILVETELWPFFLREAIGRDIPIHVINGRISNRSVHGYMKWKRIFAPLLEKFETVAVQSKIHQKRFIDLGADPAKVSIAGNLKFSAIREIPEPNPLLAQLMERFSDGRKVLVAGSTHPGEETAILRAFKGLYNEIPGLKLVLAPRHLERVREVTSAAAESGFPYALRSRIMPEFLGDTVILILDTHGELASIYKYATLAFVGGSMVPVGGHNVLEPARFGVPVIYGMNIENFLDEVHLLDGSGGGQVVGDELSLAVVLHDLLKDPDEIARKGKAARDALNNVKGVLKRTMDSVAGSSA